MKHILICLAAILTLTNCTKRDLTFTEAEPEIKTTVTNNRGLIDANLISGKLILSYIVTYTKSKPKYVFSINCPQLQDPNFQNYIWHPKWTYVIKYKGGVKTQTGGLNLAVSPIDFLSVNVEIYCQNKYTGVKSGTLSKGIIIKI